MFSFLFFINLGVASLASLASANSSQAIIQSSETTYKNDEKGYVIRYPEGWTKEPNINGFDIFLVAPQQADGHSLANVSIISGPLPKDISLDVFAQENMKHLQSGNKTIKILDSGKADINGTPTQWTLYTRSDDQTKIQHYFLVANGLGILITAGAAINSFDTYKPAFDQIIHSFAVQKH